ncbi:glycoside hydrolase family 2 TIM barrel-domain containing protein [Flavobacterium sp.]|uniref:glycoside hydrolase family 2 protein n=1 Tax=Flavobacterium sp. TaxID=239 RepID=UPI00121F15F2|nr:glycoside hydrolase family 2 TIM barrel-domain containing protein [Flavobacterium sp.]RZJ73823.1 MAG: beta-glucuronidase [Flavobacterium sp.]
MNKLLICALTACGFLSAFAQDDLIMNTDARRNVSLNGTWHYIIDTYETGFYDYRFKERKENDNGAYWNENAPKSKSDLIEHQYSDKSSIKVPGDWNHQDRQFLHYEGTVWYQRKFDRPKANQDDAVYLYFGAVNYEAHVYLNGKKLGWHKGGFTPFNFKIPANLLKDKDNFLVVKVDNKRHADEIPTLNTDWWNYGGITRDVKLVIVPKQFISQYNLTLNQKQDILSAIKKNSFSVSGFVKTTDAKGSKVIVEIPELKFKKEIIANSDSTHISFDVKNLKLWQPEKAKLYEVKFTLGKETVSEKIGFRKVEVQGKKILVNGRQVFLRGISIHEEIPQEIRRAHDMADAKQLLNWAKDLGCNMVRLAHYPHNENMTRLADEMGILVWSEIPVYWTIDFANKEVLKKAEKQLDEMIARDRNRASVVIWSVGNETPVSENRTRFMSTLVKRAKAADDTRLIAAALEVGYNKGVNHVDDPLGEFTDIVALNEYLGWYSGLPDACQTAQWEVKYDKPFFISETGAEAVAGFHADKLTRFSEEYQEWYYQEQIKMFEERFPDSYSGLSPWLLADFRSPKRNNPDYQELWNRKGVYGEKGEKKKAFYVLQAYYKKIKAKEDAANAKN